MVSVNRAAPFRSLRPWACSRECSVGQSCRVVLVVKGLAVPGSIVPRYGGGAFAGIGGCQSCCSSVLVGRSIVPHRFRGGRRPCAGGCRSIVPLLVVHGTFGRSGRQSCVPCVGSVSDETGETVSGSGGRSIALLAGFGGEFRSEERRLVKERGIEENGKLEHVMRFSDPPFLCKQIDSFSFRA